VDGCVFTLFNMHVCSLISLSVTSEEYKLLHRLNQVTIAKYQDMTALAGRLNEVSQRLNDKCKLKHINFDIIFSVLVVMLCCQLSVMY
jgi:hypothetical protein